MKNYIKKIIFASLFLSINSFSYDYVRNYDLPEKIKIHNGNIEHQNYLKITDGYIREGGFHIENDSDNKDGDYILFEQDWQIQDGDQFLVYMKFIKEAERYSSDPYKYIINKKLEIYYDAEFLYMQYDGFKKRFDINPKMILDFRKSNRSVEKYSDRLFIQRQFNIGNLYINMRLY